jgi:hypothetical protein
VRDRLLSPKPAAVRSLADPTVLLRALGAGALSGVLCYPRLAHWAQREQTVGLLVAFVGLTAFTMWAAVFAWHERHGGRSLMPGKLPLRFWAMTAGLGLAGAVAAFHFGDPVLRRIAVTEFPQNAGEWAEHLLFNLGMEQLFLCSAPFAVGLRLLPNARAAGVTTVLFGLFVFALKLRSVTAELPADLMLVLLLGRALQGAVTVWLYWQGGVPALWSFVVLLQFRHWFAFA